jgi:uncharacterized cupin superfamily protein
MTRLGLLASSPFAESQGTATTLPPCLRHTMRLSGAGELDATPEASAHGKIDVVQIVNVGECLLDEPIERGEFRGRTTHLSGQLGATVTGASIYEMASGDKRGPYHYHHGFEEWMYVISGAPVLRDPTGQRTLQPGDLVAFEAGPLGAHTFSGPGRVIVFSAGSYGWGEAFVSVYPDSDKIGAAPGVMFRRSEALESWVERPTHQADRPQSSSASPQACPQLNALSMAVTPQMDGDQRNRPPLHGMDISSLLVGETWGGTLHELTPGEATGPYHYEWCRESWGMVLSGHPTLRHADGTDVLKAGDTAYFPQGPAGAREFLNNADDTSRVILFTSPTARPLSAFYPDQGTVLVRVSNYEAFLFNETDHIEDYWDGEPGAGAP